MMKYALPAGLVLAVLLAACHFSPPPQSVQNMAGGASLNSFLPTPLTKGTTRLVLDRHSNGLPGQFMIADVLSYNGAKPAITAPAGWTLIRDDSTPTVRQALYWHVIQENDSFTPTWTFSEPVDAQGTVLLLDKVAPASPVDGSSGNLSGGNQLTAKSAMTTSDGDFIIAFYATDFGGAGSGHDTPANMGVLVDQESAMHPYWILGTYQGRRGNTGDAHCSSGQVFNWAAAQVAIRRASAAALK